MNTPETFQLIDGTFTPDQARHILGALVKSKIAYHTLENHSEGERSGILDHSEERLQALRKLDADLKELFKTANQAGAKLNISGTIAITMED